MKTSQTYILNTNHVRRILNHDKNTCHLCEKREEMTVKIESRYNNNNGSEIIRGLIRDVRGINYWPSLL